MELWAAIDLMEGSVVTLVQGRATEKTRWKDDPVRLAERWEAEGAHGLHIIDLDAALERGSNKETVLKIIKNAKVPVQVGGGMRSENIARGWLESGAGRIVIGTMAYSQPSVLAKLLDSYGPERVVVAADYKDGEIVTRGWTEGQGISVEAAAKRFERAGVTNLLTTSVGRDGMGAGPDTETVRTLAGSTGMGIIASGGIRDLEDLERLQEAGARGAIIGRALYEGSVKLSETNGRIT
jgi:phosphoribosylformimino-5-aminoimidazole carboxamide ribotide isomerase